MARFFLCRFNLKMSNKAGKQAFRRHCDDCDTDFSRREHLRKHYQSSGTPRHTSAFLSTSSSG